MLDNHQARRFITALTGSLSSPVTFQTFYDPKPEHGPTPDGVYPETWTATLDDSLEFLDYKQSQKCGVYVCINGTDGHGRDTDNIISLRTMLVDFDGMCEPEWALPRHLVQKRDETHGHAFWFINSDDLSHDEWTILQKQLSMFYGSDSQVIDPARVIRVPGSQHWKNPSHPECYNITLDNSGTGHRYEVSDIRDAHMLDAARDAELNRWASARDGSQTGAGYDNDAWEISRFVSFATHAAHPAVQGSGSLELFRVACYGHDHGIDQEHALDVLWEHYNPRCEPAWGEHEKDHFESVIARAYKYPSSAAGCKSTKTMFQALPALQEPSCGWEKMHETFHNPVTLDVTGVHVTPSLPLISETVNRGTRISNQSALVLGSTLTAKSSHYDFGLTYLGLKYDGINLIRSAGQYFQFTGRSWEMVSDDVIKAEIQRAFHVYKPADSLTSGISRIVMDLTNVPKVENGTWLTDLTRDTSNLAVFRNGLVDLNDPALTVHPHSHEFFVLNELDYDFTPGAACPTWLNFLSSIWGANEDLKAQLQEYMGYCLVADSTLQKFAIFVGKSRAGKGTITRVMTTMVGKENMTSPSLSNLVKDSALYEMSKSSLTLIPEAHDLHPSIRDSVLSNLKSITGGDPVTYHVMYKGGQSSVFSTKVVISTNNMPRFNDPSGALMNRGLVFPFTRSFAGNEDTALDHKLAAEMAGITQWAIEGLRRLRRNHGRFTESAAGRELRDEIRKDMFPLSGFVDDCVVMDSSGFAPLEDLYKAYRVWSSSEGMKSYMTKVVFNQVLRNSALDIIHQNNGYHGMTVRPMFLAENVLQFKNR